MKAGSLRISGTVTGALMFAASTLCFSFAVHAQDAAALRAREAALRSQLSENQFRRPLVLESNHGDGALEGDVYAVVAQPYALAGRTLPRAEHWCEILMLQTNIKDCSIRGAGAGTVLSVAIARKFDQRLTDAHRVDFTYRVDAATPEYLAVRLSAGTGPLGTKDYRIFLEATPLDAARTFVHLSYSYAYGAAARVAMQTYLATAGRNKVGFSVAGRRPDGTPVYVGGERGMIERNTMRYYLAIEAFLGTHALPAGERTEKRLNDWFTATERYPRQLREMERDEYLAMKRRELARRQPAAVAALLSR